MPELLGIGLAPTKGGDEDRRKPRVGPLRSLACNMHAIGHASEIVSAILPGREWHQLEVFLPERAAYSPQAMLMYPDDLIVLFDGVAIGQIAVAQRHSRKFFGRFTPGPGFDETLFADAVRWANVNASASPDVPFDQAAWDHWIEAIGHITAHISLPEVPVGLEEFAVDEDYEVEVTFDCDSGSSPAGPGSPYRGGHRGA